MFIIKNSNIIKLQSSKQFSGNIVCHYSVGNVQICKEINRKKFIMVQFLTTGCSLSEKSKIQQGEVKIF